MATITTSAPPRITRSEELPWLADGAAGSKVLSLNGEAGWFTMLVRGAAGQVNPAHTHIGGACFYVLSGGFDYRGGSAREGDWVWEPAGSVHEATTHPVDTVYLAQIYGPVAFHGKDGKRPRILDWQATQRMLDRAAGSGSGAAPTPAGAAPGAGFDPLDATLVHTATAAFRRTAPGREVLVLRTSPDTGHAHLLMRVAAGTEDPPRLHLGACELFVLDGSIDVDGTVLRAGDHLLEPAGTRRGTATALTDATYLLSLYGAVAHLDEGGGVASLFDWQSAAALA